MRGEVNWLYEGIMALLSLSMVWLIIQPNEGWVYSANIAIWAIFFVDYVVRLYREPDRWLFVRRNIPDLIAIMPLDFLRLARLIRIVRLLRLLRATLLLIRVRRNLYAILMTNHLGHVLAVIIAVTLISGVGMWIIDPNIGSVSNGVWWSISTVTGTVLGVTPPSTTEGRVVAVALKLLSVGAVGMITATLASYFIGQKNKPDPEIERVQKGLRNWESLTLAEKRELALLLQAELDEEVNALDSPGADEPRRPVRVAGAAD